MADGEKCNSKNCEIIVTEFRKNGQYKKYCSPSCRRLGVTEKCKSTSLERTRNMVLITFLKIRQFMTRL